MKKVAIDLTWVRHNKVGGTESSVRNLLDGFAHTNSDKIKFILLVAKDNADSFKQYASYECFNLKVCDVCSENKRKRVIWQNLHMGKLFRLLRADL